MGEQLKVNQDDQNKQRGRAGKHIGMALAAGIAAASPAQGQEVTDKSMGYEGDSYSMDYDASSYEFTGSEEALKAIDAMSTAFNRVVDDPRGNRVRSEVLDAMRKFIDANPYREGKTITTKDPASSEPSYDPVFDLEVALRSKARRIDPLLAGVLLQELQGEQERRASMDSGNK